MFARGKDSILRTQSARHRVDHVTICGRSCAHPGHFKPLCARVDGTFVKSVAPACREFFSRRYLMAPSQMVGGSRASSAWLAGGGEMGARMRAKDWSASPLGHPDTWSQSIKTAVCISLNSRFPIVLWVGPELRVIYNDPYIPFLGERKHPSALGDTGREIWKEIWPAVGPMHDEVAAGRSTSVEDFQMFFTRHLPREEVYVTFSYSPIFSSNSRAIDGVFCACIETTEKVVGARRLTTLRDLGARARSPLSAATIRANSHWFHLAAWARALPG
jgi:hypothetical protein